VCYRSTQIKKKKINIKMNGDNLISYIEMYITLGLFAIICFVLTMIPFYHGRNISKTFDVFSIVLPFNIAKKCIDKETGKEIYIFNSRIVQPNQYLRLKQCLSSLCLFAIFTSGFVISTQAYEEVYDCPFESIFKKQSGWSCIFQENQTEYNCQTHLAKAINALHNLSLINDLESIAEPILCTRLNYNVANALVVALVSYNLTFIGFLTVEKFHRYLIHKLSSKFAHAIFASIVIFQTIIMVIAAYFLDDKYFGDIVKYWVPIIYGFIPPILTSGVGQEEVVDVVQREKLEDHTQSINLKT